VLKGDGRKHSVHDERADCLPFPHQASQDVPVAVTWLQNPCGWLGQPGRYRRFGLRSRERALEDAGIRPILRKAHRVSQANRKSSDPDRAPSSQARLASCCSDRGW
jgi:hypothetical protein